MEMLHTYSGMLFYPLTTYPIAFVFYVYVAVLWNKHITSFYPVPYYVISNYSLYARIDPIRFIKWYVGIHFVLYIQVFYKYCLDSLSNFIMQNIFTGNAKSPLQEYIEFCPFCLSARENYEASFVSSQCYLDYNFFISVLFAMSVCINVCYEDTRAFLTVSWLIYLWMRAHIFIALMQLLKHAEI